MKIRVIINHAHSHTFLLLQTTCIYLHVVYEIYFFACGAFIIKFSITLLFLQLAKSSKKRSSADIPKGYTPLPQNTDVSGQHRGKVYVIRVKKINTAT